MKNVLLIGLLFISSISIAQNTNCEPVPAKSNGSSTSIQRGAIFNRCQIRYCALQDHGKTYSDICWRARDGYRHPDTTPGMMVSWIGVDGKRGECFCQCDFSYEAEARKY